jgi:hypothetical protein
MIAPKSEKPSIHRPVTGQTETDPSNGRDLACARSIQRAVAGSCVSTRSADAILQVSGVRLDASVCCVLCGGVAAWGPQRKPRKLNQTIETTRARLEIETYGFSGAEFRLTGPRPQARGCSACGARWRWRSDPPGLSPSRTPPLPFLAFLSLSPSSISLLALSSTLSHLRPLQSPATAPPRPVHTPPPRLCLAQTKPVKLAYSSFLASAAAALLSGGAVVHNTPQPNPATSALESQKGRHMPPTNPHGDAESYSYSSPQCARAGRRCSFSRPRRHAALMPPMYTYVSCVSRSIPYSPQSYEPS